MSSSWSSSPVSSGECSVSPGRRCGSERGFRPAGDGSGRSRRLRRPASRIRGPPGQSPRHPSMTTASSPSAMRQPSATRVLSVRIQPAARLVGSHSLECEHRRAQLHQVRRLDRGRPRHRRRVGPARRRTPRRGVRGGQRRPQLEQMREPDPSHPRGQNPVRPGERLQPSRPSKSVYPRPQLREVDGLDRRHPGPDRVVGGGSRHGRGHPNGERLRGAQAARGRSPSLEPSPIPERPLSAPPTRPRRVPQPPAGPTTTPCRPVRRGPGRRTPPTRPRSGCRPAPVSGPAGFPPVPAAGSLDRHSARG